MPPKLKKNVLLMLTNVGLTSLDANSIEEEPFIDKAKYAMRMLIEKKIFLQPKDEIGIITMGDETDNPEDIEHVKLYCEHLLIPNWEMVKYVNSMTAKTYSSSWIEALQVALCFMRKEVVDPAFRVFLVIFNNFKEDDESISQFDPDFIINDLKTYDNLFMLFVGENTEENLNSASEKLALSIINEKLAQYEQINNFIEARRFHIAPPVSSMPWKCALQWDGICIPCSTYVKVADSVKIGPWKLHAVDDKDDLLSELTGNKSSNPTKVVKEKMQFDLHRNEIAPENIINGYKFGGKYIPVSGEDEEAMKYSGTEKGLIIHSFVPQTEVKLEYWSGSGSRIIVPDANEDPIAFYSLLKAMVDKQYAAIVRKVYAKNNLPKMGVLFPKADDDEIYCFVHIELPFINDIREIPRRPVKSLENVSKEKLEALDDFIDSMTISEKDTKYEYLNPGKFPNLQNQYHWNAIAQRALNPEETDLLPVNDYIMKYLETPSDLIVKAQPKLKKLNELFGPCLPVVKESKKKEKSIAKTISATEPKIKDPVKKISQDDLTDSTDEGFMSVQDIDIGTDDLDDL